MSDVPFPILQPWCVRCLGEHDEALRPNISYGLIGCQWCNYVPPVFFSMRSFEMATEARKRIADYREACKIRFGGR